MSDKLNRRDFLQKSTLASAGLAGLPLTAPAYTPLPKKERDLLRVGIRPLPERLSTAFAREESTIEAACRRALGR